MGIRALAIQALDRACPSQSDSLSLDIGVEGHGAKERAAPLVQAMHRIMPLLKRGQFVLTGRWVHERSLDSLTDAERRKLARIRPVP
jgi:hypothetical protein